MQLALLVSIGRTSCTSDTPVIEFRHGTVAPINKPPYSIVVYAWWRSDIALWPQL
jgi:hypothetical protein